MSRQKHMEKGSNNGEEINEIPQVDHSESEARTEAAADFLDKVDEVLDENAVKTGEIDDLMNDIDKMFNEVDAEALVKGFIQKGGQ